MPNAPTILTGPAGSGKTVECLRRYREALRPGASGVPGRGLWLTPTNRSKREVLNALPDASLPVCFAPNVVTFAQFAEQVLDAANASIERLHPAGRQRLLRLIIDRLNDEGVLRHFTQVLNTAGFLDLAAGFIAELKRDEIWPEHFTQAVENIGNHPRHTDLAAIYDAYQTALVEANLYDSEGLIWSARDALAKSPLDAMWDYALIVVDGFSDFTRTQVEILAILASQCEEIVVTLPMEASNARGDLFAKSKGAMHSLKESLGEGSQTQLESGEFERPAMRQIATQLFTNPGNTQTTDDAEGIEILAVTGTTNEADAVAGRVKQLLQNGVDPRDVVIAVRDLDESGELLLSRLRAAGVPAASSASRGLMTAPVLRALFEVLRLESEGWPFDRLRSILRSNHFRPPAFETDLQERSGRLLSILRREKLHESRPLMRRKLEWYAQRPESEPSDPLAFELFEHLDNSLQPFRSKAPFSKWIERLLQLGSELGLAPTADDAQQERNVWEKFRDALFHARHAQQIIDLKENELTLGEFVTTASEILQSQPHPAAGEPPGCVRVLSVEEVRNLNVRHLFLAGMTERAFPRMRRDDCLYSERERRALHAGGLPLQHNDHRLQDELLLFYSVVTRARQSLTISYPETGSQGDPQFPSPYVIALRRLFDPQVLNVQHVGNLDPVPQSDSLFTPADGRRFATVELLENRPELFASLAADERFAPSVRHVLAAVDANAARFETRGWTPYEGETSPRESLSNRFHSEYQFSVTQLEKYAGCRFRFMQSDVLRIDPLESPAVATDYMRRGTLMHDALAAVHRAFIGEPSQEIDPARLTEAIREEVAERLGRRIDETELAKALTEIECRLLSEWSEAFRQQWSDYLGVYDESWDAPPSAKLVELPFGQVPEAEPDEDRYPPAIFGQGEQRVKVRGRIDRIDVGTRDGTPAFTVIDYKSGMPQRFSIEDVQSGRALQLVVYMLAAVRLNLLDDGGEPWQMGYWSLKENGFVPGIKSRKRTPEPLDAAILEKLESTLDELIPTLADGIRAGHFPVDSQDPRCTERCEYNTVCRVSQLRRLAEPLGKVRAEPSRDE